MKKLSSEHGITLVGLLVVIVIVGLFLITGFVGCMYVTRGSARHAEQELEAYAQKIG